MARLARSLGELRIVRPMTPAALGAVMREVVRRNRVRDGIVYVQVTRGVAPRDHAFPVADIAPGVVVTARSLSLAAREKRAEQGIAVITVPDSRWARVDIKTVGLLPNVLAQQKARESGVDEAWFVDGQGFVTEGTSTNAWIVTSDGRLVTRAAEAGILRGITRAGVLDLAESEKITGGGAAFHGCGGPCGPRGVHYLCLGNGNACGCNRWRKNRQWASRARGEAAAGAVPRAR